MGNHDHKGYWGPPTSSIDWCEDNYVVSFYIAEFFNSFSSFAMIILGETACYSIDQLQSAMASRVYMVRKSEYPDVKRVFEAGIGLYALAVVVWTTDLSFCTRPLKNLLLETDQRDNPPYPVDVDSTSPYGPWIVKDLYLHAWWHIFVSMGLYLLSTVIMLDGLISQGWKPEVEWKGGWLPGVKVTGKKPEAKTALQ
ncbi:Alkaline ceramidase 3 [Mortierella sp. GBA30]|nr:Alkaline ceramidase 3 [Mortierella sp. GBA30]